MAKQIKYTYENRIIEKDGNITPWNDYSEERQNEIRQVFGERMKKYLQDHYSDHPDEFLKVAE